MASVRDARPDDAAEVAEVHVRSWKAAYRGLLPAQYLEELSAADRVVWWTDHLRAEPCTDEATLIVEDETGAGCGFAVIRRDHDAVALLAAMYLDPGSWGRGLGRHLHEAVRARLRAQAYERVVLWVHPENARARRFYEAAGYADDGVEQVELSWGLEVSERRYSLSLL